MSVLVPWKWDADSTYTSSFKLESNFTDFDEPSTPKSVYFCSLSTITGASNHATFKVYYRLDPEDSFTLWGTHVNDSNNLPEGAIMFRNESQKSGGSKIFQNARPIPNVYNFQIKIEATGYGEFAINDVNIIFRSKRKWTATDVKTYIRAT